MSQTKARRCADDSLTAYFHLSEPLDGGILFLNWCFAGFKRLKKEIMEGRGTKCYLAKEARREETIRRR